MITIGALHPTEFIPKPPDTTLTFLIASSSGQSADWPSTLAQIVRFTGQTTSGNPMVFNVNMQSTKAAAPSSGGSSGSTMWGIPVMGQGTFQREGASTGFSVAGLSSGYVTAELWRM